MARHNFVECCLGWCGAEESGVAGLGSRGNPNMNSLIGLGALTSFAAGVAAPMVPGMAFDASFLEEPVMLLAFVLLGRTLEARARLKASGEPLAQTPPSPHH